MAKLDAISQGLQGRALAELVRLKLENARLRMKLRDLEAGSVRLRQRTLELFTLYNVSKSLSLSTPLEQLFELSMKAVGNSLGVDEYTLLLHDELRDELVITAYHGISKEAAETISFKRDEGIAGRVFTSGRPAMINDVSRDPDYLAYKGHKLDIGSLLSLPLVARSGKVLGVLNIHKPVKNAFAARDRKLFGDVAQQVADAIENLSHLARIREQSRSDELTGLRNRRAFRELLATEHERARRFKTPYALILTDLDHFKRFNDDYGHPVGDRVLSHVARLFVNNLRATDCVARYGGEEFVALLAQTNKRQAMTAARKLLQALRQEQPDLPRRGKPRRLSVTAGVAAFPEDADDSDALFEAADAALYRGKSRGRDQVVAARRQRRTIG